MVDIASIAGLTSALKSASDILRGIVDVHDLSVVQSRVVELQREILTAQTAALGAQSEQFELIQAKRDLEEKIAKLESWTTEKQRYELCEITPGTLAYSLRAEAEPREPSHQICANCYSRGHKSILQKELRVPGRSMVLVCHACGEDIYISGLRYPEHASGRRHK